ncbi:MAG: CRISPR-associated endonuclease Cas9 [Planctomycetota bacterium]|jgi:5-methylcytosine-specific restriction endonuclease McrA
MQKTENAMRAQLLDRSALVLNRSWMPVHVTTVRRALCMMVRDVARVVAPDTLAVYAFPEWIRLSDPPTRDYVRSPSVHIPVPEVVVLRGYDRVPCHEAPFTRRNLFLRDDFTCQYCGRKGSPDRLSIDHVTPKSRGGRTTWENCVLACVGCNARKADRHLKDSGLRLLRQPMRPRWTPYLNLRPSQQLESWHRFAPDNRRSVH